jgi:hypothetical protein
MPKLRQHRRMARPEEAGQTGTGGTMYGNSTIVVNVSEWDSLEYVADYLEAGDSLHIQIGDKRLELTVNHVRQNQPQPNA